MNEKLPRQTGTQIDEQINVRIFIRAEDLIDPQIHAQFDSRVFDQVIDRIFTQINAQFADQLKSELKTDQFTIDPQLFTEAVGQMTL